MIPLIIIGNPANRRVTGFLKAARGAGAPTPVVLAHRDLLDDLGPLLRQPDAPRWVRIEAVGEDDEVERRLLALGYAGGPDALDPDRLRHRAWRRGEVLAPAQHHRGFLRYLRRLDEVFAGRPAWRVLSPAPAIERLFDKGASWRLHRDAGLPVPEALETSPKTPDELRAAMVDRGWRTAFVKLSCGSSASGLAVFMRAPTERVMTTLAYRGDAFFNSLRVQRVSRPEHVDRVLGFVLEQGAHVERAVPKAKLRGAWFDLRILVIDGEPCFTVVRQSRHPITNLHLGGWRGALSALQAELPGGALEEARGVARRAAALHGCFHLGVDVLLEPGTYAPRIVEANAFGDLVPNLEHAGRSVYEHQLHRLAQRGIGFDP